MADEKKTTRFRLPGQTKHKLLLLAVMLFLANVFLYIDTLNHDFLMDDHLLIVENHRIKDIKTFIETIDGKFFAFPDFPYLHYWRPLTLFSFYIDYSIWGLNPSGFHFTNIIINGLNALLIFFIFYRLSREYWFSFFVALLFTLHPSHAESASWISGRTDLLAAFFVFAAMLCYILFLQKQKIGYYLLTLTAFIPGLLSKENAVLFPLAAAVLYLIHLHMQRKGDGELQDNRRSNWQDNWRDNWRNNWKSILKTAFSHLLPFLCLDILFVIIHNHFSGIRNVVTEVSVTHIWAVLKACGFYGKVISAPFFKTPHFSMQQFDSQGGMLYASLGACLLLAAWVIYKRRYYWMTIYSSVFFIFLLPVLNPHMMPSYPKVVIRFAYIPAVIAGVFLLETLRLLRRLTADGPSQTEKRSKLPLTAAVVLLTLMAFGWTVESIVFQKYFKNKEYRYTLLADDYPDDCSILLPLALMRARQQRYAEALQLTEHALAVNHKDSWLDVSMLGSLLKANLLVITDRGEEGRALAETILKGKAPKEMQYFAYLVLAKYHEKRNQQEQAFQFLLEAEKMGQTADLYFRMTLVAGKQANFMGALNYLEKAKTLNPNMANYEELKKILTDGLNRQPGPGPLRPQEPN